MLYQTCLPEAKRETWTLNIYTGILLCSLWRDLGVTTEGLEKIWSHLMIIFRLHWNLSYRRNCSGSRNSQTRFPAPFALSNVGGVRQTLNLPLSGNPSSNSSLLLYFWRPFGFDGVFHHCARRSREHKRKPFRFPLRFPFA